MNTLSEIEKYNKRQFMLMLEKITLYKGNKLSLKHLVDDIEGLIFALKNVSEKYRSNLLGFWSGLDNVYAWAISENNGKLTSNDMQIIQTCLHDLEEIAFKNLK